MPRYPTVGPYNLLWLAVTRDSSSLCTTAISCQFVYPDTSRLVNVNEEKGGTMAWDYHR
jgi:hypothetical protein